MSLNVFEQHIAAAPNLGCLQSTPLLDVVTDVLMGNYGRRVLPNGPPDLVNEWTPQFNKPVPWCKRDKYIWNHFKADIYIYIYSIMPNWCGWFASIRWQNKIFQLKSTTLLCVKPPLGFAEFMFARFQRRLKCWPTDPAPSKTCPKIFLVSTSRLQHVTTPVVSGSAWLTLLILRKRQGNDRTIPSGYLTVT